MYYLSASQSPPTHIDPPAHYFTGMMSGTRTPNLGVGSAFADRRTPGSPCFRPRFKHPCTFLSLSDLFLHLLSLATLRHPTRHLSTPPSLLPTTVQKSDEMLPRISA